MSIGKKIAYFRKAKNITQQQLAEYLSVTPQTVSRWESNDGAPDIYLLPELAVFFNVPIEELFGINNTERVTKLVYKYSILRDERSFKEAMAAIDNSLDNAVDKREKQQLLAQRMHMYLQKSRALLDKADELANDLLEKTVEPDNPLHLPIRFQKIQFNINRGKETETLIENKQNYSNSPSTENTLLYACALLEAYRYSELLKLFEEEKVRKLIENQDENAVIMMEMIFTAAYKEGNLQFFKQYFDKFESFADIPNRINVGLEYVRLLSKNQSESDEIACLKNKLLELSETYKSNEYLYNLTLEKIKAEYK